MKHQEEDMQPRFPSNNIICKDCEFARPGIIGYKNLYCECYPEGKPTDILFDDADCEYYLEDIDV